MERLAQAERRRSRLWQKILRMQLALTLAELAVCWMQLAYLRFAEVKLPELLWPEICATSAAAKQAELTATSDDDQILFV